MHHRFIFCDTLEMSSARQRRSQRRQQPTQERTTCNNILSYTRGERPRVSDAEMAMRRQKQRLMCDGGLQPSCTDYGPDRKELYPGFYFCQQCDDWDNRPVENKRLKQANKRYQCRAGHKSFISPTTKMKTWSCDQISKRPEITGETDNIESNVAQAVEMESISTPELSSFQTPQSQTGDASSTIASNQDEISNLQDELRELRNENKSVKERLVNEILDLRTQKQKLQKEILRLNKIIKKYRAVLGRPKSLADGIETAINFIVDKFFSSQTSDTIGKIIGDVAWRIRDGAAQIKIMQHARTYLRTFVYTPQAVLRAMDMAGGTCNMKAYDIIRKIETDSRDPLHVYKQDSTVLPHEWKVRAASRRMNQYCQKILPMKHYHTQHGECLEYEDCKKFLYILFKAFGLTDVAARRSVDIALTLDGSNITKHLSFVMSRIKLVDVACRNPHTGVLDLDPGTDIDGKKPTLHKAGDGASPPNSAWVRKPRPCTKKNSRTSLKSFFVLPKRVKKSFLGGNL